MGYRVDGKLVMKSNDFVKLKACGKTPEQFLADCTVDLQEDFAVISYEGWKMYDNYPEVKQFNNFLDYLDELELGYSYIRTGEEPTDVEQRGDGGWLYTCISIEEDF